MSDYRYASFCRSRGRELDPVPVHLVVIDHEIISTSFSSLPLNHSRRVVKYVHKVLVNRFALGRLAWFVFLASPDCCVALLQDAMGLSAVCDCGIS